MRAAGPSTSGGKAAVWIEVAGPGIGQAGDNEVAAFEAKSGGAVFQQMDAALFEQAAHGLGGCISAVNFRPASAVMVAEAGKGRGGGGQF